MYMTDEQIYRDYIEAKNPKRQIKILAELNSCPRATIEGIIERESQRKGENFDTSVRKIKGIVSPQERQAMYEDLMAGMLQKDIATKYGRSESTVSNAISRERKERTNVTFAADIPIEERERLTAEVMDQISEKPAEPTAEEQISASADEEIISRATSIDIAKALQLLICEDFKGYTITIENTGDNYIVDVQGDADGATIRWKK